MCLYQGIIIIIIYAICTAAAASFQIIIIHIFSIHYKMIMKLVGCVLRPIDNEVI